MRYFAPLAAVVAALCLCPSVPAQEATPADQEIDVSTHQLQYLFMPKGGRLEELRLLATGHDLASEEGLVLEGFGVGSPYLPNRRLNEKTGILQQYQDRPVVQYTYDCDGPNINGLHVTRIMEPLIDETSLRVRWKVENRGKQDLWVSPWVRSEAVPGGKLDAQDRLDAPTEEGIRRIDRAGYHLAVRNWLAATDPATKETVYTVYNADHVHSFLTDPDPENGYALQASFVPRLFKPGDAWETVYRVNVVRGLTHVDFAAEEIAAQLDYAPGKLELRIASTKPLPPLQIEASIRGKDGQAWPMPARQFTATPEKVVVASYPWTAPADGAYEFLAKLSADGKDYPINREMGTPHNGIDTQFVAGKPASTPLEAWTDAPYALNRGVRRAKRALAIPGETAVWFETSLDKVFRQDIPEASGELQPRVDLSLARNERESFQIAMRPPEGKALTNVSFRVSDLGGPRGAKIPAANVAVYNVRYYPVRVPSHFEGPTGDWPDALTPFQAFTARGGETTPVWFTVYAPTGIPAGAYAGTIEMESDELGLVELGIKAEVYDFDLPATPALNTDFGFWRDGAVQWAKHLGYKGSEEQLVQAYLDNALDHRVTLRQAVEFPAESPDYAASLRAYAPRVKELIGRGVTGFAVPPTLLDAPDQLKLANAFVVEQNLRGRVFCPIAENPPPPAWPRLSQRLQQWTAAAPDIPFMVTTSGLEPYLPAAGGIWCVHLQMLDTLNNEPILARIGEGGSVWTFVNQFPSRPYGNFFVDFQGPEHRLLFWQAWALGMTGFHYWSVNYVEPGENPYQSQLDTVPTNGDGFLVYPGANGPVNSIRWENIRDGIEDYDYFAILKARTLEPRGNAAAQERARKAYDLQSVVPDLVRFSREPRAILAKRNQVATTIVDLGKKK